jgi:hypothetical protein
MGWLGIRIMGPSGATCLPADFCFREKHYQIPTKRVGLVHSGHHPIEYRYNLFLAHNVDLEFSKQCVFKKFIIILQSPTLAIEANNKDLEFSKQYLLKVMYSY